jgi:hypothetical protein
MFPSAPLFCMFTLRHTRHTRHEQFFIREVIAVQAISISTFLADIGQVRKIDFNLQFTDK